MTPNLETIERASGAAFVPWAGGELPARFGDLRAEWSAVRERCGLLDARFRSLLRMTGADRTSFLQGMVSNDVAILGEGEGTYAALLTNQGRVVSDLRVYALTEDLWLDVPASHGAAVRTALERFIIADDVEFVDDIAWGPIVAIEGPQADTVLIAVFGPLAVGLKPWMHRLLDFQGMPIRIAAASHGGETGYLLFGGPAAGPPLWERCRAAGAAPVGMDALDVLRVEAGIPWCGRDMDESTLISEVGLQNAISYKKGCYLGQEVVERVAARGQVHRKLVGLLCAGSEPPAADSKLVRDGKDVGTITSAVWSPARDGVIALGYARRECWDVGCEVQVTLAQGSTLARVTPLPFYARRT